MVQLNDLIRDEATQAFIDELTAPLPDHTQLPCSDGTFVKNFQEHPQSLLLTDSITPVLDQKHPDGRYAIGQDSGIYWRQADPPESGAEAPDWFYVPGVPSAIVNGTFRRSYVLWKELIPPLIVLEFASGDGSEERDRTPLAELNGSRTKPGKFWVYEQILRVPYYGIYEVFNQQLTVYHLIEGSYQPLAPNQRGHFPIKALSVELGLLQGAFLGHPSTTTWMRWWDEAGNLLLTGQERANAEQERANAEQERANAEQERANTEQERANAEHQRAERLAAYLKAQGIDPDNLPS